MPYPAQEPGTQAGGHDRPVTGPSPHPSSTGVQEVAPSQDIPVRCSNPQAHTLPPATRLRVRAGSCSLPPPSLAKVESLLHFLPCLAEIQGLGRQTLDPSPSSASVWKGKSCPDFLPRHGFSPPIQGCPTQPLTLGYEGLLRSLPFFTDDWLVFPLQIGHSPVGRQS